MQDSLSMRLLSAHVYWWKFHASETEEICYDAEMSIEILVSHDQSVGEAQLALNYAVPSKLRHVSMCWTPRVPPGAVVTSPSPGYDDHETCGSAGEDA